MDPLLLVLASLIILHAGFLIVGTIQFSQAHRQVPSLLAATTLIGVMVLAMITGSWPVVVLAFALYRCWIMIETLLLAPQVPPSALLLAPVNVLAVAGALTAYFTEVWLVFGLTYLAYWSLTLAIGSKLFARLFSS